MSLRAYDLSAGLFIRGLSNLSAQLTQARAHAAGRDGGEAALLNAQIAEARHASGAVSHAPNDVHGFTLAAQVHWAAEGAMLAIAHLLGAPRAAAANDAKSFADLQARLDVTITYLRGLAPSDLEAGLERTIVIEQRRGSVSASGSQFLVAFAIPHFFYHVTTAYGIMRNQGVQLTMGDFLGAWGAP
jgi:hypothetical protein